MGDPYYVCDTGVGNYNSEALTKHKINWGPCNEVTFARASGHNN